MDYRICRCEKVETCRLCWLYHTDPRYKKLWDNPPVEPVTITSPAMEKKLQEINEIKTKEFKASLQLQHSIITGSISLKKTTNHFFLINLKRRPDRLKKALTECIKAGVEVQVVEAVDGLAIGKDGTTGCRLSHIKVLQHAVDNNLTDITVYEDDVKFVPDFQEKYKRFMEIVPVDWQAIFLGGQHIKGEAALVREGVAKASGPKGIHRTHAYRIRGAYIPYLLNLWKSCNTHIDHCWGYVQENQPVYAMHPWGCLQDAGKSDINGRERGVRSWDARKVSVPKPCGGCKKKV